MLQAQDIVKALPSNLRTAVTPQFVAKVNAVSTDPEFAEQVRDNFISYASVMRDGKFKTDDYLAAVVYVSHKLLGDTNEVAYSKTFPTRYNLLVSQGKSKKDISSYVHAYAKGKLVNLIWEQTLVPSWVLNQDVHQAAINHLAKLMVGSASEKVQCEAATALLTHLGKPKETGLQINIGSVESSGMAEMRDQLAKMAEVQQQLISMGVETTAIAAHQIIDIEGERV